MKTVLKGRNVDLIPHARLTVVRSCTATVCVLCDGDTSCIMVLCIIGSVYCVSNGLISGDL